MEDIKMKNRTKINIIYTSADITDENLTDVLQEQECECSGILGIHGYSYKYIILNEIVTKNDRHVLNKIKELMGSGYVNSVAVSDLALVGDSIQEIYSFVGLAVENKVKILIAKHKNQTLVLDSLIDTLSEIY